MQLTARKLADYYLLNRWAFRQLIAALIVTHVHAFCDATTLRARSMSSPLISRSH
jgi:hypothetical protein